MQKLIEKMGISDGAASALLWVILSLVLLAIVVTLGLWLVRTLRPSLNMNAQARGGRPQRLAITDAFPLDREGRKLVIVRRDNTEHLLLIGGPNDVVVESNITRHDRVLRGGLRPTDNEGDAPAEAAPVPVPPAPAPVRPDDFERTLASQRPLAPQVAPAAPVIAVAPRPAPKPVVNVTPPLPPQPVVTPPVTPQTPPPAAPKAEPAKIEPEPMLTLEALLPPEGAPAPVAPPAPEPAPTAPAPRAPAMSEMARRLNEALQKPMSGTLRPPFNRSIPPAPPVPAAPPAPVPPPAEPVAPPPAAAAAPQTPPPAAEPAAKADMDLLEEEMARLLGRPAQPKKPETT